MRVCFTGHRRIDTRYVERTVRTLEGLIEDICNGRSVDFYTGGAVGFDTIAALCVLVAQDGGADVRLHLILPCRAQTRGWSVADRGKYDYIMSRASSVTYVSDDYTQSCMQERNRALVDASDICVAYYNGMPNGGTAYTVRYAQKRGVEVKNIYMQ